VAGSYALITQSATVIDHTVDSTSPAALSHFTLTPIMSVIRLYSCMGRIDVQCVPESRPGLLQNSTGFT